MLPLGKPSQKAIDTSRKCQDAIIRVLEKFQCTLSYRGGLVIPIPMGSDVEAFWADYFFKLSQGEKNIAAPRFKG